MKIIIIKTLAIGALLAPLFATSAPLNDFQFKSPAFNGNGYGTYALTIENEQYTRQQAINAAVTAAAQQAQANAANTPINQFLTNLESRIYAQISQNLATAMFANGGTNSGSMNFEGNTIFWTKDSSNVYLTVTDTVGNQTTITVPLGQFQFQ